MKYKIYCQIRSAPYCLELRIAYSSICKQVKLAVRNAICNQKQCRDSIKGLLDCHCTFHTDGDKIMNILNVRFGSVFIPRLPCQAQPLQLMASPQHDVDVDFFSPANVRKYILRLNPRKSPGMDGIHAYVIKMAFR
ncbi:hypothetical protein BpHYR1_007731, partial [Brachionus plicatilis]